MSDQLKNEASVQNPTGWQRPPTFECQHCGVSAPGSLSDGGYFGEPLSPSPPAGWLRRYSSCLERTMYACSIKCANAIDEGTDL